MSKRMAAGLVIVMAISVVFSSGCATVLSGPNQKVNITSSPPGAKVYVDGKPLIAEFYPEVDEEGRRYREILRWTDRRYEYADETATPDTDGKTPIEANLSRRKIQTVRLELGGYEPYELTVTRGFNAITLGNIIIGGGIGIAIDAMTGAIFTLQPSTVAAHLDARQAKNTDNLDLVFVFGKGFEGDQIGQLTPQ